MNAERRLTVLGALDAATAALARAGIEAPRREATRLLADLLGWTPAEVTLGREAVIEPDRRRWIDRAVARRAQGEPLSYVTGLAGFRRLLLRSDRRALIPRPETEGLIDRALALCPAGVAIDVGTGTGCLALSLADEGRYHRVVAIDRSAAALELAAQNRRATGLAVDLVRGDLSTAVGTAVADLIVSNPPYLSESEYLALDSAVRDYEPRAALASGADGLDATARLLADARRVLRPAGVAILEIAEMRAAESLAAARDAGWTDVEVADDLFGRPRYLIAKGEGQ
ncbi:MAG: peptide chain release factor N(5)-glutamine methyltransferase [Gemmatimonadales bacterium]